MFRMAPRVLALLGIAVLSLAHSASAQPIGGIDSPLDGSTVSGIVRVSGFVLSHNAIDRIDLLVDGNVVNQAHTGLPRPDVIEIFPEFANSPTANPGFVTAFRSRGELTNGPHTIQIMAKESETQLTFPIGSVTVQVDNAANQAPFGWIDLPAASGFSNFTGSFPVIGWAIDDSGVIARIDFFIDGEVVAGAIGRGEPSNAVYGSTRPDIQAAFPDVPFSLYTGFEANIDASDLVNGVHLLSVVATDLDGGSREIGTRQVLVNSVGANLRPFGRIDFPLDDSALFCIGIAGGIPSPCTPETCSPAFNNIVKGWALDVGAFTDRGQVSYVELLLDGQIIGSSHDCVQVNGALINCYGVPRPDVARLYPGYVNADNPGFNFSFFLGRDTLDTSGLITILTPRESAQPVITGFTRAGKHTLAVRAGDEEETVTQFGAMSVVVLCDTNTNNQPAFGYIDTPTELQFIDGIFEVFGWAYDFQGVLRVEVEVDGQVVGNATYGLNRPDVPPNDPRVGTPFVGFSYIADTTKLSDNAHDLAIFVVDRSGGGGQRTEVGRRKFVVDNNLHPEPH